MKNWRLETQEDVDKFLATLEGFQREVDKQIEEKERKRNELEKKPWRRAKKALVQFLQEIVDKLNNNLEKELKEV